MKKLLTLIILTLTLIGSFTFNVFAINVDYSFNITDNKKWNLNTGLIENDLKYSITSKMIVGAERIYTQSQTYHHVLFWNKYNEFIGYKNTQYSIYENDKYISNIEYGNSGFDAPETAKYYSFMIYKSGNNVVYDELNGQTLNEIFNNYDNTNLGDKENPILDNYTINEFGETQLTGKNLFDNIIDYVDQEINSARNIIANVNYDIYEINDLLPNTDYVISGQDTVALYYMLYNSVTTDKSSRFLSIIPGDTFNTSTYDTIYLSVNKLQNAPLQLELGSTATAYEPHDSLLTKDTFAEFETIPNVNYVETDNNRLRYVMNEDEITSNNQPLYELNGQTLNDVFNTGNLVTNGDFSDGTTGWSISSATGSVANGIYSFTPTSRFGRITQTIVGTSGNIFYILSRYKANSDLVRISFPSGATPSYASHSGSGTYEIVSNKFVLTTSFNIQISDWRFSDWTQTDVDYFYAYNLTTLGIDSLTQSQLDEYFEIYKYFDNGGTDPQTFTYDTPIYYDITYRLDTYFNGLDLTPQQFVYYQEGYNRIFNNEQANDFIIYYAGQYAKSNNSNLGYTDEQWEQYYNNYLLFDDANTPYIEELNYYSLNEIFIDSNDSLIDNITILANQTATFSFLQTTNLYDINDKIYIYYNQVNDISQSTRNTILIQYNVDPDFGTFVNNNNQNAGAYSYLTPIERAYQYIAIYTVDLNVETIYNNIKLINLTTLSIDNLSKAQIDNYYNDYINNQLLEQNLYLLALQTTSFNIIQPYYDYNEPAPDDFLDVDSETFLDNLLTDIGFNNDLGRIGLSLVVLFFTALTLIKLNMPNSVIISVEILTFVGLSFLGWLPAWINIVIALGIIILLYLRFKGNGGGSNEESD